jgi:hypothetical protein
MALSRKCQSRPVKYRYIAAALVFSLASPAFAQSSQSLRAQRFLQAQDWPTSKNVYGGHRFGTDPDPNVQFDMLRQRNWRKG